jgi:hypothetical protein
MSLQLVDNNYAMATLAVIMPNAIRMWSLSRCDMESQSVRLCRHPCYFRHCVCADAHHAEVATAGQSVGAHVDCRQFSAWLRQLSREYMRAHVHVLSNCGCVGDARWRWCARWQ